MQRLSWAKWAWVLQGAVWASHMEILGNLFTPPSAPVSSWLCWTWKFLAADTDSSSGSVSSPLPLAILRRRLLVPILRCLRVYLGFVVWADPQSSSQNSNEPEEKFSSLDTGSEGSIHLPSCCHLETPRVSKIPAKGRRTWHRTSRKPWSKSWKPLELLQGIKLHSTPCFLPLNSLRQSEIWDFPLRSVEQDRDLERAHHPSQEESVSVE